MASELYLMEVGDGRYSILLLFFYLFAWKRRRRAAWARDISTADETAPIVPWPATYEEGAHEETEYP